MSLHLSKAPSILQLHLKRFGFDRNLMRSVKLSHSVSVLPHLKVAGEGYTLFAAIIHSGGAGAGHYYTLARPNAGGKWYKFDDVSVTSVDFSSVQRRCEGGEGRESAYMLFYSKDSASKWLFRPGGGLESMPEHVKASHQQRVEAR
jgi:ubiquitin C-terminal hydrolase